MFKPVFTFLILHVFATYMAFADSEGHLNVSCSILVSEMDQHIAEQEPIEISERLFWLLDPNPVMQVLETEMAGLDEEAYYRIRSPLNEYLRHGCKNLEEIGLQTSATVDQVLNYALETYGLDRSQPRWGLTAMPELDFRTQSGAEVAAISEAIFAPNGYNPVNDIYRVAISRYFRNYGISTPEDFKKVNQVMIRIGYYGGTHDEPFQAVLDRLADQVGLKKSN